MGAVNHGESVGPGKEAPPKPKAVGRLAFQHRVHPEPVCACMYGVCVCEHASENIHVQRSHGHTNSSQR